MKSLVDIQKNGVSAFAGSLSDPVATASSVASAAAGSTLGLEQALLANAGQPALTVLAVGYTNTGRFQGVSLGDGNVVEVYASGADFNEGIVLYREFMSRGEPIIISGISNGAIITASEGFYGFSEQANGNTESPMPLLSYGLSFDFTFFFGFRNFGSATNTSEGLVHVVNGPNENIIKLTDGLGNTIDGQEEIKLDAWEYVELHGTGVREYILSGSQPMMACTNANMDSNSFYDSRLIMPLSNDMVNWPRNGDFSAPFPGTLVDFFTRDGVAGSFTVAPGSPYDMNLTGASDLDYEPNGATRTLVTGIGSWYSGADSAGLEATPAMPVPAMSQVVAQPLFIADTGDGGNSGVAIASIYEGNAKVFEWDDNTKSLSLKYDVPLLRNGVTINSKEDQKHPSSGVVANETSTGSITLVGELKPGIVVADVPIMVVVQNGSQALGPSRTLRSQNGTTDTAMQDDDDETLSLGLTPDTLRAEITEGADGILYRRVINGGNETWLVA